MLRVTEVSDRTKETCAIGGDKGSRKEMLFEEE